MSVRVYLETGVGHHREGGAAAWSFDLPHWGLVGLGGDEASALVALAPDRVHRRGAEEWTTVKVLRRLAWHETGELVVLRRRLARAACRAGGTR